MKEQPPKLAEQLLLLFCKGAFVEDLLGDLYEMYEYKRQHSGKLNSRIYYWYQAIRLLFSYAITKRKIPFLNGKIDCRLLEYELYAGTKKQKASSSQ